MRYSLPCKVDGQGAWDTKLDLADSANYVTEKVLENMGFVHVSLSDYSRKMVNDVNVEIHRVKFKADFVVLDYVNEGEPSILFGRDFLATTKSQVDFGLGEIRMNLTKFKEGIDVIDLLEEVGSSSKEVVKIGKANHNKGYNINKLTPPPSLRLEEIPPTFTIPSQPIYHPLTTKQKEKMKEVLDIKYKELEESKPILEVLENYVMYKKKLDEILIGKERLNKKEFSEEDKINGVVEMVALVDTGASVSVLPYSLYKDLGLGDPRPYQTNLTMADNTQAKAMGEVKNVRIQIGYQAYVVDLLILDIPVDPELPLLLGRPFLRTCGAIIDMGRGTLCIDDGVIRHTYFPKPRSKSYVEAFEMEGEDDWLGSFEVGRDEDGNVKYGPVAPSFIDIEDDMERALAMEAYFNPFKNVIVFKKLVDFLGSLPVQLKNLDWGNEGYGTYKKVDGDGDWHARFEIVTPSGRKFNRAFKTKTTTRKLSGKFKTKDVLREDDRAPCWAADMLCRAAREDLSLVILQKSHKDTLPNPFIAEYERRNKRNTITYSLQPVSNANLKWKDLPSVERHAYYEKLSKLQERSFGVSRVANWRLFDGYGFEDTLREMMKLEYIYEGDGDHILTLSEFAVVLGLFMKEEVEHRLFEVYFGKLEVDDKQFDCKDYWTRVGHYVTRITSFLSYYVDEEIKKCLEPIECDYWTSKMLANELDEENTCLKKETGIPTQAAKGSSGPREEHRGGSYGLGGGDYFTSAMLDFRGSSSGYAVGGSFRVDGFNDDDMDE
ncbi:retrovirus-related pol polyprotein from transposon TNT 1-94 [Tanacetum coccineum]